MRTNNTYYPRISKAVLLVLLMTAIVTLHAQQRLQSDPVRNLEISVEENDEVFLTWDFPESVTHGEMTLTWSNMVLEDWTGSNPYVCGWDVMQHFDTLDIRNLTGWKIKSITCIPPEGNSSLNKGDETFYVKVWKGEAPDLELIYQQPIEEPIGGTSQTVVLNEDVLVEAGQDLWIGFYGDQSAMYPWAIDGFAPAPESKGFLVYLYDDNSGDCLPSVWVDYFGYFVGNTCISATLVNPETDSSQRESPNRENHLTGYKIYRNGNLVQTIPYPFMTYFTDLHYTKELEVNYCVTAVYDGEESEMECVTAPLQGVSEDALTGSVNMTPNPATGMVTITGEGIREVEVHNLLGQRVASMEGHDAKSLTLSLEGLPQGVYLVSVRLADGKRCEKKLVIQQ